MDRANRDSGRRSEKCASRYEAARRTGQLLVAMLALLGCSTRAATDDGEHGKDSETASGVDGEGSTDSSTEDSSSSAGDNDGGAESSSDSETDTGAVVCEQGEAAGEPIVLLVPMGRFNEGVAAEGTCVIDALDPETTSLDCAAEGSVTPFGLTLLGLGDTSSLTAGKAYQVSFVYHNEGTYRFSTVVRDDEGVVLIATEDLLPIGLQPPGVPFGKTALEWYSILSDVVAVDQGCSVGADGATPLRLDLELPDGQSIILDEGDIRMFESQGQVFRVSAHASRFRGFPCDPSLGCAETDFSVVRINP